jgi:transposase
MSDAEWAVIEPTLPAPAWLAGKGGRPARRCRRDYVDAIRYLVKEGIQWRGMPADLPHWRTVYDVADGWHRSGATEAMHHQLRRACRIAAGREPEPTAAVIDSQSVRRPRRSPGPAVATTRARRSTAASGTSPWTRSGCC